MIIDFRGRPPTDEFKQYFKKERVTWSYVRYVGTTELPESYTQGSVELFIKEMEEAGVTKAVITGRNIPGCVVPNEHVADLVSKYPDKLIGFAGIDATNKIHKAIPEIEKCVKELGLKGVNMDPGRSQTPMHYNDRRLYPIYEKCQELGIPVSLMSAVWSGPDISYTSPVYLDQVATDFPELKIIPGHGCWPYVLELLAVAIRHTNVYVSPDCYFYLPGGEYYVEAANTFLPNQVLFGTAFPYRPFKWSVEKFMKLPFTDEARERVLYKNALKVLGME